MKDDDVLSTVAVGRPYATKGDFAYAYLRRAILSAELSPGAPLNQALLAQEFGISTTPLREALRKLSAEGLVVIESHRDARVTDLSIEESRDLLEMRLALDPLAAALAAQRRSRDDIKVMREALKGMEARHSGPTVVDPVAHRRFHEAIFRASHNELLITALDGLYDKAERYRLHGMKSVRNSDEDVETKRRRKSAEHLAMLESVISGDGQTAADVMRRHIATSLEARAATSLTTEGPAELTDTDARSMTSPGA